MKTERFGAAACHPAGNGRRTGVRQCAPRGAGLKKRDRMKPSVLPRKKATAGNERRVRVQNATRLTTRSRFYAMMPEADQYELSPSTGTSRKSATRSSRSCSPRSNRRHSDAPTSLTRAITRRKPAPVARPREAINRDGDQLQYKIEVVKLDGTSEKLEITARMARFASAK